MREYWLVDPEIEVVKVYRRQADGAFPRVAELTREAGDALESPLFPGLAVTLAELFA